MSDDAGFATSPGLLTNFGIDALIAQILENIRDALGNAKHIAIGVPSRSYRVLRLITHSPTIDSACAETMKLYLR